MALAAVLSGAGAFLVGRLGAEAAEAEAIRQMQAVTRTQDQLECRVARHLFLIRCQLSDQQARRLMALAAGEVLQPHGWQGISSCCLDGPCTCVTHRAAAGDQMPRR
jgi:CRP-like cAMP-binding protein